MSYVRSDCTAFGIPVPLDVWEAESTLGQATPQAGLPVATARSNGTYPRWTLTASGPQTAGTDVQVRVVEPGFAPLAGVVVREDSEFVVAIVTRGSVVAEVGGETHRLRQYDKVLLPAGLGPVKLTPVDGPVEILECRPPA